jgi:hypothetical protein
MKAWMPVASTGMTVMGISQQPHIADFLPSSHSPEQLAASDHVLVA